MTRIRTKQLIKEIAGLITKYSYDDWAPILSELKQGSDQQKAISKAIDELAINAPTLATQKPKRKKAKPKTRAIKLSADRKEILTPLRTALVNRQFLSTARSLREISYNVGVKGEISSKRNEAVDQLITHLDQLEKSKFQSAMMRITMFKPNEDANFEEDYGRWFEMIVKPS